jgi:hypothetical protein
MYKHFVEVSIKTWTQLVLYLKFHWTVWTQFVIKGYTGTQFVC